MATTKTRKVARIMCDSTGRGHWIFNDKLADGTRSLKDWGWTQADYTDAKGFLEGLGCKVTLVQKEKYSARGGRNYTMTRLHVTE